jgi:hypothetical protein
MVDVGDDAEISDPGDGNVSHRKGALRLECTDPRERSAGISPVEPPGWRQPGRGRQGTGGKPAVAAATAYARQQKQRRHDLFHQP